MPRRILRRIPEARGQTLDPPRLGRARLGRLHSPVSPRRGSYAAAMAIAAAAMAIAAVAASVVKAAPRAHIAVATRLATRLATDRATLRARGGLHLLLAFLAPLMNLALQIDLQPSLRVVLIEKPLNQLGASHGAKQRRLR